jgi:hypothetical protein
MTGPYECYACGKRTKGVRSFTLTVCLSDDDGRRVPVGPDCHKKTRLAGVRGYQPPKGGPRLYFSEDVRAKALSA